VLADSALMSLPSDIGAERLNIGAKINPASNNNHIGTAIKV
jgi:hypothetical protein